MQLRDGSEISGLFSIALLAWLSCVQGKQVRKKTLTKSLLISGWR